MTAITTVPAHLRGARVTPYLLAAALAVALWLLLGTHTAFASDKSAAAQSGAQHAAAALQASHETSGEASTQRETQVQPAAHSKRPKSAAPAAEHSDRDESADEAPTKGHAEPPPALRSTKRGGEGTTEPAANHFQESEHHSGPLQPASSGPTVATREGPAPAAVVALPKLKPQHHGAEATAKTVARQPLEKDEPARQSEESDDDQTPEIQPAHLESYPMSPGPTQAASQPAPTHAVAGSQALTPSGHKHHAQSLNRTSGFGRQAVGGTSGDEFPAAEPQASPVYQLTGITMIAYPSQASAPVEETRPPAAIGEPRPPKSRPAQAAPAPRPAVASHPSTEVITGPLAAGLQSGLSLIALALLVPLLGFVLLFQIRLMRLMRSMQATAEPNPTSPRYLSLTHEEVRELAPELAPALTHHRFCESTRHQGRQRRANWLELDNLDAELPHMWATCEICHHQRITQLTANGGGATVPS